ncbi:hypothetical protein MHYP_G00020920 [Metynnis hypsauchen]
MPLGRRLKRMYWGVNQSVGAHSSEAFSLSGLSGPSYQEAPPAQRWVAVCPDTPRGCLQPRCLTATKAKEG